MATISNTFKTMLGAKSVCNPRSHDSMFDIIDKTLLQAQALLQNFILSPDCINDFELVFGAHFNRAHFQALTQAWMCSDFSMLPEIEVRKSQEINGAAGAFSKDTGKIYLAQELVNGSNKSLLLSVLLEEIGHYIDVQINQQETPGDEGALFALLAQGYQPNANQIAALKAEDDWAQIILDGQQIAIEQATFTGTASNDTIAPGNISGGVTADPLGSSPSNLDDLLSGEAGNDFLSAGEGNNTLDGGSGNDNLSSGAGNDSLSGGDGNDFLSAGNGTNTLDGGSGNDRLSSGAGDDALFGGDGNDNLSAGNGNNTLEGGSGDDFLSSGTGNDSLVGGDGNDFLLAGLGIDTVIGGIGNDTPPVQI